MCTGETVGVQDSNCAEYGFDSSGLQICRMCESGYEIIVNVLFWEYIIIMIITVTAIDSNLKKPCVRSDTVRVEPSS